ncbi:MAG TPA: hypothetical protein VGP69_14020 [Gaiellaceae bacterium]|jgi:hypothetical protein|nr:hypothetical protein [Gaiellaceae bacterium]
MNADTVFEHRDPIRKPGWQKALPWIVGVVAIGALLGFIGFHYSNTGHSTATPLLNKPADDRSAVPPTVKLTPGATIVARRFIETAVARKNLPDAYKLVTDSIKQGQTLAQWRSGNIAVIPYPVDDVKYAPMKIDFSYPKEAMVEIALLPKANAKIKAQLFQMDLVKRGDKWLVNSWYPKSSAPVPNGSENNGAGS